MSEDCIMKCIPFIAYLNDIIFSRSYTKHLGGDLVCTQATHFLNNNFSLGGICCFLFMVLKDVLEEREAMSEFICCNIP